MNQMRLNLYVLISLVFSISVTASTYKGDLNTKKIEIGAIGTFQYDSSFLEERSDVPFKNLLDDEFIKLYPDTVDFEAYRPALIFFEKGFVPASSGQEKPYVGNISVSMFSGKYQFPEVLSDDQKTILKDNIQQNIEQNLKGTSFSIVKWNEFELKRLNGLFVVSCSYELKSANKKTSLVNCVYLYDKDMMLNVILSVPKKQAKKWTPYFNDFIKSFKRKMNIADRAIFEYPTTISNNVDIPFRYLLDNEFKKVLGDSVDYDQFKPGLLFLDHKFAIADTLNVPAFGCITVNVEPVSRNRDLNKDSINMDLFETKMKAIVSDNIVDTDYKILEWGDFILKEVSGLPCVEYSYKQQLGQKEPVLVKSANVFDKDMQVIISESAPLSEANEWADAYDFVLSSYKRLLPIKGRGTIVYPVDLEERSDIPFVKLVDKESKQKMGESVDYEKYRPTNLFLKKHFDENDSIQLQDFGSIVITDKAGSFDLYQNPDKQLQDSIINESKAMVERYLSGTNYKLVEWGPFEFSHKKGYSYFTYAYTHQLEGKEPIIVCATLVSTSKGQTQFSLTCKESEYLFWKPQYDEIVASFRLDGER